MKFSIFTKLGEFLTNHPNISKFSAPAAPKMGHFSPFFQFFGAFDAEKWVILGLKWPPILAIGPHKFEALFSKVGKILKAKTLYGEKSNAFYDKKLSSN